MFPHELPFIHWIHQFRTPYLDRFFTLLDYFDRQEFFFLLIPIVWLVYGSKPGARLFAILFLSHILNHNLKELFLSPRPFHLDPSLGIIQVKGMGFPSGAAQTVTLLSSILLSSWKNSLKWPLIFLYITLISFSRIYLGLHFPSDILGGWLIGLALYLLYRYAFPYIERLPSYSLLALSQAPALLLPSPICASLMGMGIGLSLTHRYHLFLTLPTTRKQAILKAFVGTLSTFAFYFLTQQFFPNKTPLSHFLQFFSLGFWVSLGGPFSPLWQKLYQRANFLKTHIAKK